MQFDELKDKLLKMLDGVMGGKSEYAGVKWTLAHLRIEFAVGCLGIACVCATATDRVNSRPSMLRFTYCGAKNAVCTKWNFVRIYLRLPHIAVALFSTVLGGAAGMDCETLL